MGKWLYQIFFATKLVLKNRVTLAVFIVSAIGFFGLLIAAPVLSVPGNTLVFQLGLFKATDYALMTAVALLTGLNFGLQTLIIRQIRLRGVSTSLAQGPVTAFAGFFGGIAKTATCASCLAPLFSFLGLGAGSVLFVLEYRTYFMLAAFALIVATLYLGARRLSKICAVC